MYCRKPVIATAVEGVAELVIHDEILAGFHEQGNDFPVHPVTGPSRLDLLSPCLSSGSLG
ncbi:MAG: hypothetical protein ACE5OP_14295 [Candidatus Glassbacteria bacterium]